MKKIALILSDGFEELEAVTVIDLLRRATASVEVLGIDNIQLTGAHGITFEADERFDYYSSREYDGIVLVGGMGNAITLSSNENVLKAVKDYSKNGKLVAGICASPSLVFSKAGILKGKRATCYPSDDLIANIKDSFEDSPVVVDGNIITSQSPDTAMEFALHIIDYLGLDASGVYKGLKGK